MFVSQFKKIGIGDKVEGPSQYFSTLLQYSVMSHRPSCLGGRYGFSFTHFAIHSIPSVTPAPVSALQGRIIQSRDPIRFEQS